MVDREFDVFLCHNSDDKSDVIEIARQLRASGIKPWLDIWELRPGINWVDSLNQQIEQIKAAAIFIGDNGFSDWQNNELNAILTEFQQHYPIIPVLLNNAPNDPHLPPFINMNTWVDFRLEDPNPLGQLVWGITGLRPSDQNLSENTLDRVRKVVRMDDSVEESDVARPKNDGQKPSISSQNLEWAGDWFVNVGEGDNRTWADCRKYGFLSAGQGAVYSNALKKLEVGSAVYAYISGFGYVGLGKVTQTAVPIRDFVVGQERTPLLSMSLQAETPEANSDNLELSEWVVGVKWLYTFPKEQAQRFVGAFANQNVVCKLRSKQTLEFLREKFGWTGDWFVNVGEGSGNRAWEDCVRYGFMSAGQSAQLTSAMRKLEVGHTVYAYIGGTGYVGFGEVIEEAVPIDSFMVGDAPLLSKALKAKGLDCNVGNHELSEWVARIKWLKTYPREQAKWITGAFAHRGTLCKLGQQKTLDFLHVEFGEFESSEE